MTKKEEDNISSFENITDYDLHAYVDGQLDVRRRKTVEAYLDRHSDAAARVRDYMAYNDLLKQAHDGIADEQVPHRLMSVLYRTRKSIFPVMMKTAAVLALCLVSASGGWFSAQQSQPAGQVMAAADNDVVGRFLQQVSLNTLQKPDEMLDINAGIKTDPLNFLTQKVALEMQAPDLTAAGYSIQGRRLVTGGEQEFVELSYGNGAGETVKLYMKTRWDKEIPDIKFNRQNNHGIAFWQEGPLVYALRGDMNETEATRLADLIRVSMTKADDVTAPVQNVEVIAPQSVTPQQPQVQTPQVNYGQGGVTDVPTLPLVPQPMNAVETYGTSQH